MVIAIVVVIMVFVIEIAILITRNIGTCHNTPGIMSCFWNPMVAMQSPCKALHVIPASSHSGMMDTVVANINEPHIKFTGDPELLIYHQIHEGRSLMV